MKRVLPVLFILTHFSFMPAPASARGLSGRVARHAMCEGVLTQCMNKIRAEHPCKDENSQTPQEAYKAGRPVDMHGQA